MLTEIVMFQHLLAALGIGLLIGAERERRKAERQRPATAGVRTFTVAALVGATALLLGDTPLLIAAVVGVAALAAVSYWQTYDVQDPGLTTELALVATVVLGAMAVRQPVMAGGVAALIAIVLAARGPLHRFVGEIVTPDEMADALLLAGAALTVLPLLPDQSMGPYNALNPHSIWLVVVMILGINMLGNIGTRALGARLGVPMLGLASGFMSSSATIGAMGAWLRINPGTLAAASAGAVLSTVATFVQMALVVRVTSTAAFAAAGPAILSAAATALACGGLFTLSAWRAPVVEAPRVSRSFGLAMALGFAATLSVMLIAAAALRDMFGEAGLVTASAIAGVLDVHAAAIAVAAQVADGTITPSGAVTPILAACTSSALIKAGLALTTGTRAFAARVAPCQIVIVGVAWAVAALG